MCYAAVVLFVSKLYTYLTLVRQAAATTIYNYQRLAFQASVSETGDCRGMGEARLNTTTTNKTKKEKDKEHLPKCVQLRIILSTSEVELHD